MDQSNFKEIAPSQEGHFRILGWTERSFGASYDNLYWLVLYHNTTLKYLILGAIVPYIEHDVSDKGENSRKVKVLQYFGQDFIVNQLIS